MTCDLQDKIYKNFVTYVFCLTFAYQRRFVLIAAAERWYLLAVETFFGVILTYFDGKDTTDSVCIKETITNSFRNRFATLVLKLPLKEPNNVFDLLRFHCFLVWPIYFIQLIAICSPSDFFIFQFYCADDLFSWRLVTGLWTDWYGYLYDYLG